MAWTGDPNDRIARIEVWSPCFELATPLVLGGIVVDRRDFVVVRITTGLGLVGTAYALTRGAPIGHVLIDLVAPLVMGQRLEWPTATMASLRKRLFHIGTEGILCRALSIVDVCLWEIAAKAAGEPLWRLLKGDPDRSIPLALIAPYIDPTESDTDYADRIASAVSGGYLFAKVYPNVAGPAMGRRLEELRRRLPPGVGIVVDAGWSWDCARDALRACESWEPAELAWIEDPFASDSIEELLELRAGLGCPLAMGDEVSSPSFLGGLVRRRAVDILRLDVMAAGGISGVLELVHQARRRRITVAPHIYAEYHRHLAFAVAGIEPLERYPVGSSTWPTHVFLELDQPIAPPQITRPTEPGLGVQFDWDAVAFHSTESHEVDAKEGHWTHSP